MHFFFKVYLFIWLCWVFAAACGLSLVMASGVYSWLRCAGFSLRWLLLLRSTGSRHVGFSSCGTWVQQLWHTGLVAPRHVGSSQTRAQTCVPCTGRQILNHCSTREVPEFFICICSCKMYIVLCANTLTHLNGRGNRSFCFSFHSALCFLTRD